MNRKIIFRADANSAIGYGHFTRTLALAEMLKDCFDCWFATVYPTNYQLDQINSCCNYIQLPDDDTHLEVFLSLLEGNEIIVLDNYFFSTEYQIQIKRKGCTLVCIDDLHNKHYVSDVVINHGLNNPDLFSGEPYTKLCLGFDWALLRKPFLENNKELRRDNSKITTVVVCYGGVDSHDFTYKTVSVLNQINAIEKVIAIVGENYTGTKLDSSKIHYLSQLDAQEIALIFHSADFAFLSSSTICMEALACGVSSAVGYYIDNQIELYHTFKKSNYIYPLENLSDITDWYISVNNALKHTPYKGLDFPNYISANYQHLFDEMSQCRNYMGENLLFVDYRNLTIPQHEIIWEMRNREEIREWMDNPDSFAFESHLNFVEKLKKTPHKIYWAVFQDKNIVGSVNLDINDSAQEAERGIFISPDYSGKALGTLIENEIVIILLLRGITKLTAKVLKHNSKSIKFHLRNLYKQIHEDNDFIYYKKHLNV